MILLGGKVAVGDFGGLDVGQPPSRGGDTSLLVLAVRVHMSLRAPRARRRAGAAGVEAVVVVVQTVVQDGGGAWMVMISFELVRT